MKTIVNWFNADAATEFGKKLAEDYDLEWQKIRNSPVHKREDKRLKLVNDIGKQAQHFGNSHKFNLFTRAKFGNTFKWTLLELGHEKESVEALTRHVLFALIK